MFKSSMIVLLAIAASVVSTTADARPRNPRQQAVITCNDRGCSDVLTTRRIMPTHAARAGNRTSRHIHRSAKVRRTATAARRRTQSQTVIVCDDRGCSDFTHAGRDTQFAGSYPDNSFADAEPARAVSTRTAALDGDAVILGGRPGGCPHRFCGCEASRYLFGRIRPELNLSSNWIKYFSRTIPAAGMAAARGGHVMVLISHVSGDDWLVHDGNSGGGLTRRHVRSIRGYVIVDPHRPRPARLVRARGWRHYENVVVSARGW